jgi:DNA gyrase/topoisomerase IV subunit A
VGVRLTDGEDDVLMVSRNASAVRFSERDVRPMGRDTTACRHEAAGRRRGDSGRIARDTRICWW